MSPLSTRPTANVQEHSTDGKLKKTLILHTIVSITINLSLTVKRDNDFFLENEQKGFYLYSNILTNFH